MKTKRPTECKRKISLAGRVAAQPGYMDAISRGVASAKQYEAEAPQRATHEAGAEAAQKTWSKLSTAERQKYRSDPRAMEHPHGAQGLAHDALAGPTEPVTTIHVLKN